MRTLSRSFAVSVALVAIVSGARCSPLAVDIPSRMSEGGNPGADSAMETSAADSAAAGDSLGLDAATPNLYDATLTDVVDAPSEAGEDDATEHDDGVVTADAAEEPPPPDARPPLPAVAPGHLRLWLTADYGVHCDAATQRVTGWGDLSGNGASASAGSHLGPQCMAGGHRYQGIDLPFFDSPSTPTNPLTPYADGTLDVPLGFLAGAPYTIFVVERRWSDRPVNQPAGAMLLGTDNNSLQCPADYGTLLCFGYAYYDGAPELDNDQFCGQGPGLAGGGVRGLVALAAQPPPSPLSYDMTLLNPVDTSGEARQIWQDGVEVHAGIASAALRNAVGGSIGRCWSASATGQTSIATETRFYGDIAEVIIFDAALSTANRVQMEQYLRSHWQL